MDIKGYDTIQAALATADISAQVSPTPPEGEHVRFVSVGYGDCASATVLNALDKAGLILGSHKPNEAADVDQTLPGANRPCLRPIGFLATEITFEDIDLPADDEPALYEPPFNPDLVTWPSAREARTGLESVPVITRENLVAFALRKYNSELRGTRLANCLASDSSTLEDYRLAGTGYVRADRFALLVVRIKTGDIVLRGVSRGLIEMLDDYRSELYLEESPSSL